MTANILWLGVCLVAGAFILSCGLQKMGELIRDGLLDLAIEFTDDGEFEEQ